MIVTEEEAKTKRCQESFGPPLRDAVIPGNVVMLDDGQRSSVVASPIHCIGSACMAWEWGQPGMLGGSAAREAWEDEQRSANLASQGWIRAPDDMVQNPGPYTAYFHRPAGYCGKVSRR